MPEGITACAHKERNLLLLDVEGSDSRERKESHVRTSRQLACFAMCLSDLVIVNIKTDEVSRDSAGLALISQIRESVGKLRGMNERPVKILVLLRDFNREQHQLDKCTELIHSELKAEKISRLSKLRIDVEIVPIPHFSYLKEDFKKVVGDLRPKIYSLLP